MKGIKLVLGVTVGGSSKLLEGQVKYHIKNGYDVYLMSPDHPKEIAFCEREGCKHIPIKINRNISPFQDIYTLNQIKKQLKNIKPDLVNFGTPKMGFLGVLGAKLAGIKNRVYTCRGLRYETESGFKRKLLMMMERLSAKFATKVIYVSPSLMQKAINDGVAFPKKSVVLGMGSSNGVNIEYYSKDNIDSDERDEFIHSYNLKDKFIIGFIGRITKDKGIEDLVKVIDKISKEHKNIILITAGHFECSEEFERFILNHSNIITFPFTDNVPLFLSLFDIFVLPSYREGFPNVPIQAAAMGLPVITTDATGCIDSVKHDFNGFVYQKGNTVELENYILRYYHSDELVKTHAVNSVSWAKRFDNTIIWNEQDLLYKILIK